MSQGDAPVGRSVKTAAAGVRDLAAEAARVGAAAAVRAVEITDRKLAESKDELSKVGRAATKDWDKSTRSSRRDVLANSTAARDEVLSRAAKMRDPGRKAALAVAAVVGSANESGRRRRKAVSTAKRDLAVALQEAKSVARGDRPKRSRWPWLLAAAAVAAAIAAVVQVRRPNPLAEETPQQPEKPATQPTADAATLSEEKPATPTAVSGTLPAEKPVATPAEKPAAPKATTPAAPKPAPKPESVKNGREPAGRGQHKAH